MSTTLPGSTNVLERSCDILLDSSGNLYVVAGFNSSGSPGLAIWKSTDQGSSWSVATSPSATTIFGSAIVVNSVASAMDGNNLIHVVVESNGSGYIRYATFTTSSGTWSSWENCQTNTISGDLLHIAIDSNNKPHVLYGCVVTIRKIPYNYVYYTNKTGSSWSTGEQVNATGSLNYALCGLSLRASNYVEAAYVQNAVAFYNRERTSSWQTEGSASGSYLPNRKSVAVSSDDSVYRYGVVSNNILENGSTIVSGAYPAGTVSPTLVTKSSVLKRYVFWTVSTSPAVLKYAKHDGSSWSSATTLCNLTAAGSARVPSAYNYQNIDSYIPVLVYQGSTNSLLFEKLNLGESVLVTPSATTFKMLSKPPSIPLWVTPVTFKTSSVNPTVVLTYPEAQAYVGWVRLVNTSINESIAVTPSALSFKLNDIDPLIHWGTWVTPGALALKLSTINPTALMGSLSLNMAVQSAEFSILAVDPIIPDLYYGILKRWTGTEWIKAKASVYLDGDWQSKPLFVWIDGEWKSVDVNG